MKCWGLNGAKACKSDRSRQELSNECSLAKIGFDTAENEPRKVCITESLNHSWFTKMSSAESQPSFQYANTTTTFAVREKKKLSQSFCCATEHAVSNDWHGMKWFKDNHDLGLRHFLGRFGPEFSFATNHNMICKLWQIFFGDREQDTTQASCRSVWWNC